MKIAVLNGSPKGNELSVTIRYLFYIQEKFPEHEFVYFEIAKKIKILERFAGETEGEFSRVIEGIRNCDAVIWSFPVYFLAVPGQLKRFIELIFEHRAEHAFAGKYATSISTSAHYFDQLAHNYIQAVCEDLKAIYMEGFSAEAYDLMEENQQRNLCLFTENFFRSVSVRSPVARKYDPLVHRPFLYEPDATTAGTKSNTKKITVLSDHLPGTNLEKMVLRFQACSRFDVEIINLHEIDIKSGCLGCIECTAEGMCVYKDQVRNIYMEKLLQSAAIVYAGEIRDRYLSALWKLFFDRSFFLGHRNIFGGKHTALLISGPLRQNPNLREILESYLLTARMNIAGLVTDEYDSSELISGLINNLAESLDWACENSFEKPITFPGYAGHLLFRDFTYKNSYIFREDHQFYSKNGLYDYPQYNRSIRKIRQSFERMFKNPAFMKKTRKNLKQNMVRPFQRLFKKDHSG